MITAKSPARKKLIVLANKRIWKSEVSWLKTMENRANTMKKRKR